jgi:hypothetical protein
MTSSSPWSVKGVAHEAREAAKIAARKSGQPIGAWLSQTILSAATQELKRGHSGERQQPSYPQAPGAGYPQRQGYPAPPPYAPPPYAPPPYDGGPRPPALTTQAVIESINKLSTRIDAAEQRTAAQIRPIMQKVDQLATQIEKVDQVASQIGRVEELATELQEVKARATGPASTAPVERAVMRMSERLQKLEQRAQPGSARAEAKAKGRGLFARLFKRS